MNCPACNRQFSFLYSFRILNPLKHRCPSCGVLLTMGRYGKVTTAIALCVGLSIAGVAIFMEETGFWNLRNSLLWFAIAVPALGVPLQWLCWHRARFSVREQ
jgi:uncharacterized protein (DUF983 family)